MSFQFICDYDGKWPVRLYLAAVLDLATRRNVGSSMRDHIGAIFIKRSTKLQAPFPVAVSRSHSRGWATRSVGPASTLEQ